MNNQWWSGIAQDFADVSDAQQALRLAVRLILAALVGGMIGLQRERVGKAAGLRTHMLVSVGAAIFVLVPQQAGMDLEGLSKVIGGVITGMGFIGAGAILKHTDEKDIQGLTTAAGLWLTAALGVAAGMGREITALMGAVLALLILSALHRLDHLWSPRGGSDHVR